MKVEKFLGDGIDAAFEQLAKETKAKLKPTGSSIAASIKLFRDEMGEEAFTAIAQNPKLLDMVNLWVSERKLHNGDVMVDALMSIIPEEHRHEIDREDAASFLAVMWKNAEVEDE